MNSCLVLLPLCSLVAGLVPASGQSSGAPARPPSGALFHNVWKPGQPPFSFKYNGRDSATFLSGWQSTEDTQSAPDGQIHRYTYLDPDTRLQIVAEVRTFDGFDAVDWVLHLTNEGTGDTPILEDIEPLHWTMACGTGTAIVHSAVGSNQAVADFTPRDLPLPPNRLVNLGTGSGRSSDSAAQPPNNSGSWPFFNLQTGDRGLCGAIGWTGSWRASFQRDGRPGDAIHLAAGMQKTHLLLHPGETIRTPRILLMNWQGSSVAEAQNRWRQLMLAEYSPKDRQGKVEPMPVCWNSWGTEYASDKLSMIKAMAAQHIPADLYWIDAGWYEPMSLPPHAPANPYSDWYAHRGDWVVSKELYPEGMRPLGDALKAAGYGFLVWLEAETANGGARNFKEHPDWYFLPPDKKITGNKEAFLNLGNPQALRWITDLVSRFIIDNGLTWYRQDFNFIAAPYWAAADAPDRVGMSEIGSITGLYTFWDTLRELHPGLRIDNCASGGRRLDIETMCRSVALWRSDNAGEPIGEQYHTLCLMPWVPLTAGVWITLKAQTVPNGSKTSPCVNPITGAESQTVAIGSPEQLYQLRSGYGAGLVPCIDQDPAPWIVNAFDEFREVRPYYLGDFHALLPPDPSAQTWGAWQLQKTDTSAGVVVCLRRPESPFPTVQLAVQALEPAAQYDVEMRSGLDKAPVKQMPGSDLAHLQITLPDRPGSMLIFYKKR